MPPKIQKRKYTTLSTEDEEKLMELVKQGKPPRFIKPFFPDSSLSTIQKKVKGLQKALGKEEKDYSSSEEDEKFPMDMKKTPKGHRRPSLSKESAEEASSKTPAEIAPLWVFSQESLRKLFVVFKRDQQYTYQVVATRDTNIRIKIQCNFDPSSVSCFVEQSELTEDIIKGSMKPYNTHLDISVDPIEPGSFKPLVGKMNEYVFFSFNLKGCNVVNEC